MSNEIKTLNGYTLADSAAREDIKQIQDKSNVVYELIEKITIDEETSEIIRTAEPNGTPYNYKFMCIRGISKQATQKDGIINCFFERHDGDSGCFVLTVSTAVTDFQKHWAIEAKIEHGVAKGYTVIAQNYSSNIMTQYAPAYIRHFIAYDTFTRLRMAATVPLPVGSTIEIWGVRA